MTRRMPKRTVVMIGGGFTSALASRQLAPKGVDILVLERGIDRTLTAADEIPGQRDELRWAIRHDNAQNVGRETCTLRYGSREVALPHAAWKPSSRGRVSAAQPTIGTDRAGA